MSERLSPDQIQQINEEIFADRKIGAIKLYREFTGEGLAEAKQFIETVTAELREKCPEKFGQSREQKGAKGCLLTVALFMISSAAIVCAAWVLMRHFLPHA